MWDFAFGEQGASPLHPDRQGAGAGYEIRENRSGFPSGWGSPDGDRHGCTGSAHRFGRHRADFFIGSRHSLRLLPPEVTRGTSRC